MNWKYSLFVMAPASVAEASQKFELKARAKAVALTPPPRESEDACRFALTVVAAYDASDPVEAGLPNCHAKIWPKERCPTNAVARTTTERRSVESFLMRNGDFGSPAGRPGSGYVVRDAQFRSFRWIGGRSLINRGLDRSA